MRGKSAMRDLPHKDASASASEQHFVVSGKNFSPALFFLGIGCIIFIVWLICYAIGRQVGDKPSAGPNGNVCTMDAKICPDGTSVGRSGPNCEFSPCPIQ